MKIAIVTIAIGDKFREKMHYSTLSKIEYCKKHNYDFIEDDSVYDTSRPIAWSKILLMKKYLPQYDYIMWIDADAMILNFDDKIEDKLYLLNGRDVCVTSVYGMINTGVIIVKNTDTSLRLLDLIYEQTEFINDGNWEQSALFTFMKIT